MRPITWIIYQPYKWLVLIPLICVWTLVMAAVTFMLIAVVGASRASRLAGTAWARVIAWLTPMGVRVHERDNLDPARSYVIVSNHESHYDVIVLYGWLGVDFRWVMKQELRNVPGLGPACAALGHIFIDRSDRQAALASLNAARERITGGTSVLFFPEGTRSPTTELLPFKKGAFRFALDSGLPILPVAIRGTREVLPPRTADFFPGRAKMRILPPIEPRPDDTTESLLQRTRQAIRAGLDTHAD